LISASSTSAGGGGFKAFFAFDFFLKLKKPINKLLKNNVQNLRKSSLIY